MDIQIANEKAMEALRNASHAKGFLASAIPRDNYQRIWARDGVITGLAAISSRDEKLIQTFHQTLLTLGKHISPQGHVPSNVGIEDISVSYGGLAGRADTGSWWVIGLCLYSKYVGDKAVLRTYESEISSIFNLYQAWEYNNRGLIYVPLAGDWADEYILHGYVLYDQVLRYAAMRLSGYLLEKEEWISKADAIKQSISQNYHISHERLDMGIHQQAKSLLYRKTNGLPYLPASFHPAGYQNYFDALGNALAILFNIHPDPVGCLDFAWENHGILIPAFAPTIQESDTDYDLLHANYRYEFRNKPHEFHNGGIWPMVNGFWGMALFAAKGKGEAEILLEAITQLNQKNNWDFNECFHATTYDPCGVSACTWSAAGQMLLDNTIRKGFYLID